MEGGGGHAGEPALPAAARRAALFAWGSAVVGLGGVGVALALAPWFNWSTDALSDLGHPRHESAAVFGAGLLASGLFYVDAVLHARASLGRSMLARSAVGFLVAGGLSLSLIGVINESFGVTHFVVSVTYFTFVPLGMVLVALCVRRVAPRFALVTATMAVAAAIFGITVFTALEYGAPFPSQAVPEIIASVILAAWAVLGGWALYAGRWPTAPSNPQPRP